MNYPDFYIRREQQARELAEYAQLPQVRSIHLKMADEYAAKAMIEPQDRTTVAVIAG